MQSLSELLRTIRETIGLTQDALSDAAEVSHSLVYRIESEPDYAPKRSTNLKLYRALRAAAVKRSIQVDPDLWTKFEKAADLPTTAVGSINFAALEEARREADYTLDLTADARRCHDLMSDLIEAAGAAPVLKILEGAAAFLNAGQGADDDQRRPAPAPSKVQHRKTKRARG